uniref:Uncharacterized protein n=1 Tax=Plectus sambesii TaxID=2011161 RepID=A0A914WHQ5_9BILA
MNEGAVIDDSNNTVEANEDMDIDDVHGDANNCGRTSDEMEVSDENGHYNSHVEAMEIDCNDNTNVEAYEEMDVDDGDDPLSVLVIFVLVLPIV